MGESIRVYLVDGYAVMREAMRALIGTTTDMVVIGEAADNAGALEGVADLQPEIIVLDLATLGDEASTIITLLLKSRPQPRILVLTNEINETKISSTLEAGVKGYLLKGTAAPEILQAIRALHRGELLFTPAISER